MASQPEQIVEEQLVAPNIAFVYIYSIKLLFKPSNSKIFLQISLKKFTEFKKGITFAPTVLATLKSKKTAYQGESFAKDSLITYNNTPPMPLHEAHLGGFLFL
jgi:hypothetical protein